MAREAGAKKVFFASCSPPIRHPNVYGIDMPTAEELVAHSKTEEEVAKGIGADEVIYLVHFLFSFRFFSFLFFSFLPSLASETLSNGRPKEEKTVSICRLSS